MFCKVAKQKHSTDIKFLLTEHRNPVSQADSVEIDASLGYEKHWMKRTEVLTLLAIALLLVPWVRTMATSGIDFEVYYQAAQALRLGEDPFDLARFGHRVYKYPPWILPLFLPFSFLSLSVAKWTWALLNGLWSVDLLRRLSAGGPPALPFLLIAVAYPLAMVHSIVGQISILLLWMWMRFPDSSWTWLFSSAKVTTLYAPLFILKGESRLKPSLKTAFGALAWVGIFYSVFILFRVSTFSDVLQAWHAAADSGKELGLEVLGRENQGIPAFFVRVASALFPRSPTWIGTPTLLGLISVFLFALSFGFVRPLFLKDPERRMPAGLLICAMLQPLAWFHVFLWALPALAICLQDLHQQFTKAKATGLGLAALCISGLTQKTVGDDLGSVLESASIKSWGCALLLLWLFKCGKNRACPST